MLRSIRPIPQSAVNAHAFRAQYAAGTVDGKKVVGYLDEPGVPEHSVTETYAALKLFIDNWRWRNVPFYLRTGKCMKQSNSMVSIRFKHPPQQLFRETQIEQLKPNWILMNLQPHDCIRMEMQVKKTGLELRAEHQAQAAYLVEQVELFGDGKFIAIHGSSQATGHAGRP